MYWRRFSFLVVFLEDGSSVVTASVDDMRMMDLVEEERWDGAKAWLLLLERAATASTDGAENFMILVL